MIRIENVEVTGWEAAIRGLRNPMNSWDKSDSDYRPILCSKCDSCETFKLKLWEGCDACDVSKLLDAAPDGFMIGPNDHELMMKLRNAGTDHRKFMRMIAVYLDITAPLYWWKEFDTYKVGTVANSCSTMHKIAEKGFTLEDFSTEHLYADDDIDGMYYSTTAEEEFTSTDVLKVVIEALNNYRKQYLIAKDKKDWWQMIQLLPSSYNQKRTVMLNYEVLANMYKSRKGHKLDEWREFCKWVETLPYSELITGEKDEPENI